MAETPRRIEIPAGSPLGQILRDGITTAGEIREGDLIVYANPPAAPSVGEPEPGILGKMDEYASQGSPDFVSATDDAIGGLRNIVRQVSTPGQFNVWVGVGDLALVLASHAALRSSLEEARKDSERYRTALSAIFGRANHDASWTTSPDAARRFRSIEGLAGEALCGPRAPSPRDEP